MHNWKRQDVTEFWLGNLKGRNHFEGLGIYKRTALKLQKYGGIMWTALM
jgi:hypothetical protein